MEKSEAVERNTVKAKLFVFNEKNQRSTPFRIKSITSLIPSLRELKVLVQAVSFTFQ